MVYHDEFAVSITKIGSAFVFVYSSNIDSANIYTNNAFLYIYYVSMQSITWLISSNDASNTIYVLPSTFGFLRCGSFCKDVTSRTSTSSLLSSQIIAIFQTQPIMFGCQHGLGNWDVRVHIANLTLLVGTRVVSENTDSG